MQQIDWTFLVLVALGVAWEASGVIPALSEGKWFTRAQVAGWPVDPLLLLFLTEALLLYRSVRMMCNCWIGRCWKAFSIGVFLVAAGDLANLATHYGYSPYPSNALVWYIWIPSAGTFAMAPAFQWKGIQQARHSRDR